MRKSVINHFISLSLALVLGGSCYSQKGKLRLHQLFHYGIEHGLPTEIINCGLQDSNGFIWLGTREGLVRFDGIEFTKILTPRSNNFTSNVLRIKQVGEGKLWVLFGESLFDNNSGGSVLVFDLKSYSFTNLVSDYPLLQRKLVMELKELGDAGLLISCDKGDLFVYQSKSGIRDLKHFIHEERNFIANTNGIIWTGSKRFPHDTVLQITKLNQDGDTLSFGEQEVNVDQEFLIAGISTDGQPIAVMDNWDSPHENIVKLSAEGRIEPFLPDHKGFDSRVYISSQAAVTGTGNDWKLWYREKEHGVFLLDSEGTVHNVLDHFSAASIPNADWSVSFFKSEGNNYWLCTSMGLYQFALRENRFVTLADRENPAERIQARGILKDNTGRLFIAAGGQGIIMINREGEIDFLNRDEDYQICFADGDKIFFGSSRVEVFDGESDISEVHGRLGLAGLWCTYKDSKGKRWFGGSGVKRCDGLDGDCDDLSFMIFPDIDNPGLVYQIFEDGAHYWIVTSEGVFQLNQYYQLVGRLEDISDHLTVQELSNVHHILRHKKQWYISTNGYGLLVWNPSSDELVRISQEDGLPSNTVYASIVEKSGQHIWLSTNFGLVQMSTDLSTMVSYNEEDGLSHHEFNRISWYQDNEGLIYFGGLNGVNCLNPIDFEKIKNPYRPPIRLVSFSRFNEKDQTLEDGYIDLQKSGEIELTRHSYSCNLSFSYLDYKSELKSYWYKLENLDADWKSLPDRHLQLGNLPYGQYVLNVKAKSQAGIWSANIISIPVSVISPYYYQPWFIAILALLTGILVLVVVRWRTWYLNRDRERLQLLVADQTIKLKESLEEKDILLKEVHHRVKNNLQIISSLLNLDQAAKHNEASNNLLTQARQRIKSMALIHKNLYQFDNLARIEVESYLKELIQNLDKAYNPDSDKIKYRIKAHDLELDVDLAIPIGLIVTELVSNSYKYAFVPGNPGLVTVQLRKNQNLLELEVLDNGIGLPKDLDIKEVSSLGLRLVNMLCDQLNGSFVYKAEIGSKFHFKFPRSISTT